jgi:type IV secretory pathway TrbD component
MTGVGTVASTSALEVFASAGGALLVASKRLDAVPQGTLVLILVLTYGLWIAGLRVNLVANWQLLERSGACTNLASKVLFELMQLRSSDPRLRQVASVVGYVGTELVKEVPYYAAAFGAAGVSQTIDSRDALVFLAGTNVGAAVYEYGVGRLSRMYLERRRLVGSSPS